MDVQLTESETLDYIRNQTYQTESTAKPYTWAEIRKRLIWKNVFIIGFLHTGFVAAVIMYSFGLHSVPIKWLTIIWGIMHGHLPAVGVTAGAHRLWTHRSYKANNQLKIMLMLIYSIAGLNSLFDWVKDHRIHHKYSETDADPHNAKRGFFFAHVGWLMVKRHPDYHAKAKEIDLSDIVEDPVVMFHKKHATALKLIFCYCIPTAVPVIFWGETLMHAVITQCILRHVLTLNFIWSVNSVAHLWGDRPYNRLINPTENLMVSLVTAGEGSHNYHHTFPWDYKAAELPYFNWNSTTLFIDAMAKLGWAYDLRSPSPDFVNDVIQQIGYKSKNNVVY